MLINDLMKEFETRYINEYLRPTTKSGYLVNINNHLLPYIGALDVSYLDYNALDDLVVLLREKGLSNKTIVYVLAVLRKSINYGIRRGYFDKNIFDCYDIPRVKDYSYSILKQHQIKLLLDGVKLDPIFPLVTMAVCYGLRRGECIGINPSVDYDPTYGVLHIQRTKTYVGGNIVITPCKTRNSNRYLMISDEHKHFFNTNSEVFTSITPWELDKRFKAILIKLNLPVVRFHELRHSYATLMLQKGVNPKIVSTILGHANVGITLDIYSHPDVSMQKSCIDIINGII